MMAVQLPDEPTGLQLIAAIQAHAAARGVSLHRAAGAFSAWPTKWIRQVEAAARPTPATIARVRAYLEGREVPPPPEHNSERGRAAALTLAVKREAEASVARRAVASMMGQIFNVLDLDRPVPAPTPAFDGDRRPFALSRDPCPRCAVRGDLGCRHQRPYTPHAGKIEA